MSEMDIERLFPKNERFTFLVGAGISMDPPSNLPSAAKISSVIMEELVPDYGIRRFLSLSSKISSRLRYEMIIENLQRYVDKELSFLDYFKLITEPNLNHLFLADAIKHGHFVVTTNFDYLIEQALKRILPEKDHLAIHPVITKEDYESSRDPQKVFEEGKFPLYKIHGSKMNIIDGRDTLNSLITTMSALGRNREPGTSFIIEPYKQPAFDNLMKGRSLIIMGYSGSDDFDICPMLKDLTDLNRIIWIEHYNEDVIEISTVNPQLKAKSQNKEVLITSPRNSIKKLDLFLEEIKSNCDVEVIRIKTNTIKFIYWYLWDWLIPDNQRVILQTQQKSLSIPRFEDFFKELVKIKGTSLINKYIIACNIAFTIRRFDLIDGFVNPSKDLYQIITDLIEQEENLSAKAFFLVRRGMIQEILGHYDNSLELYTEAVVIYEKISDSVNKADCFNKIGFLYQKSYLFDIALQKFEEALNISEEKEIINIKAEALRNIGNLYQALNDYKKSADYYKRSLRIIEELGEFYSKALLLGNIGKNYELRGKYDVANEYYQKGIHIVNQLAIKELRPIFSTYEGNILKAQGDYEAALKRYEYSKRIYGQSTDFYNENYSRIDIASIYELQGNVKEAISEYKFCLNKEYFPQGDLLNLSLNNKLNQILQNKIKILEKQFKKSELLSQ